MAASLSEVNRIISAVHKNLECSICLDILEEPYSTHCNHQFCKKCIDQLFDRKKGRNGVICPLCKTKISKRGLSQNRKLVNVVAAIRTVLSCVDEDIQCKGTPGAVLAKSRIGANEVSEETPFQRTTKSAWLDKKDVPENLNRNLKDNIDEEIHRSKQTSNTRKSRKLRWSDEVNTGKTDAENTELLRTLETATLGRKTRNSKRATQLAGKKELSAGNDDLTKVTHNSRRVDSQAGDKSTIDNDAQGNPNNEYSDMVAESSISASRGRDADKPNELSKITETTEIPTKYIVAETPMLPLQGSDTEEQLTELDGRKPGKTFGKKKTSPFSDVNIRAPLKTRDPNVFDFVDDDPLDNSDLCERVKQRRKKKDMQADNNDNKLWPKSVDSVIDVQGEGSRHLEQCGAKTSKTNNSSKKNDDTAKRQRRPGKRKGKGMHLLEEAWDVGQERSSQLIDTASTVNLSEPLSVSCTDEVPRLNAIEVDSKVTSVATLADETNTTNEKDVNRVSTRSKRVNVTKSSKGDLVATDQKETFAVGETARHKEASTIDETAAASTSPNEISLPRDESDVSLVHEPVPESNISRMHGNIGSDKHIMDNSGVSDVVPPSVSSFDAASYGPINPMESPLYKKGKMSPEFENDHISTHAVDVNKNGCIIGKQAGASSLGHEIGPFDPGKGTRARDRTSLSLCSETGNTENEEAMNSSTPCSESVVVVSNVFADGMPKELEASTERKLIEVSPVFQDVSVDTLENSTRCNKTAGWNTSVKEAEVLDLDLENVEAMKVKSDEDLMETKLTCTQSEVTEIEASVQEPPAGRNDEGANNEDPKEGNISIDSTPSLCEEELYSQDTYFDGVVPGKSLEEARNSCDVQTSKETQSRSNNVSGRVSAGIDESNMDLVKPFQGSTEGDSTQASASILAKENESGIISELGTEIVLKTEKSITVVKGVQSIQSISNAFTQTPTAIKVSTSCQTECHDATGIRDQNDIDRHSSVVSVACQTSERDQYECTLEDVMRRDTHMMSKGCQTAETSYGYLPDEEYAFLFRECEKIDANTRDLCTECKRTAFRVPLDIFELVKRNMQDALAQKDSSIIAKCINSAKKLATSGVVTRNGTSYTNIPEILDDQTSAAIRVERLSFVPVWMSTNEDEDSSVDHDRIPPLESVKAVRTSKRNLVKKAINMYKKRKCIKSENSRPLTDNEKYVEAEPDFEEENVYLAARDDISKGNANDVSTDDRSLVESTMEKCPLDRLKESNMDIERVGKEMEEENDPLNSNDVILPTPPSERLKSITSDIDAASSETAKSFRDLGSEADAPLVGNDHEEHSLSSSSFASCDRKTGDIKAETVSSLGELSGTSRVAKYCSIESEGEVALRSQVSHRKVVDGKSNVRPLRLKRKADRLLVEGSMNEGSSKKVKLNPESLSDRELACDSHVQSNGGASEPLVCDPMLTYNKPSDISNTYAPKYSKDLENSLESSEFIVDSLEGIDSQILCDNHSEKVQPQENEMRREVSEKTEEELISPREAKVKLDVCEPSFAVLERKEETQEDEAITTVETPSYEGVQDKVADEEAVIGEEYCRNKDIVIHADQDSATCDRKAIDGSPLRNRNSFADYVEDDERDLFASDVEEVDGLQAEGYTRAEEDFKDSGEGAGGVVLSTNESTLWEKEDMLDRDQANCSVEQSKHHTSEDARIGGGVVDVQIGGIALEAKSSKDGSKSENKDKDIGENPHLTVKTTCVESNVQGESLVNSVVTYEHAEDTLDKQETTIDDENLNMKKKTVPDFMDLVKECVKRKGEYPDEDESDEESFLMRPCFEGKNEEIHAQSSNSDVQNSVSEKNQRNEKDCEVHVSPLSPTPPPRVKRKRTSPPEVQATLKEIKKLIRNDEDNDEENARMNETINVKKPELQFVGGISKNSGSLSSQKKLHASKSRNPIDKNSPDPCYGSPERKLSTGTKGRSSVTPKSELQDTPKMDKSGEVNGSLMKKSLEKAIITTPKLKEEKPLLEKDLRNSSNDLKSHAKVWKLPQILVPSRLNKKQMIASKYLASKFDCKFSNSFLPGTSHLIMGTDETYAIDRSAYTYKYLMALITGSWIVSFQWVHACLDSGRAVNESQFEVKGDPNSNQEIIPKYARLSRQRKESPLFHDLTLTVIGDFQASNMSKDQLVELLRRGGAKILFDLPQKVPSNNYLLVVDSEAINNALKAQFVKANIQPVHYEWITESIINYKIQDPLEFLLEL